MNWKNYFFLNLICFALNFVVCGLAWAIARRFGLNLDFVVMTSSACLASMLMNLVYARET